MIAGNWDSVVIFLATSDEFFMRHRSSSSDEQNHHSDDFCRARLDRISRHGQPLVHLADKVPLEGIVEQVADLPLPTLGGAG